jgi:hypothetical protein
MLCRRCFAAAARGERDHEVGRETRETQRDAGHEEPTEGDERMNEAEVHASTLPVARPRSVEVASIGRAAERIHRDAPKLAA